MIPRLSTTSWRRCAARGESFIRAPDRRSAKERLRAGPVAHDPDGVEVAGVPRRVEEARASLRRALPDPPSIVGVERGRLAGDRPGEPVAGGDEPGDCRG